MGNIEFDNSLQFLDLSEVDDQERQWLLSTLFSKNEQFQLPWTNHPQTKIEEHSSQVTPSICKICPLSDQTNFIDVNVLNKGLKVNSNGFAGYPRTINYTGDIPIPTYSHTINNQFNSIDGQDKLSNVISSSNTINLDSPNNGLHKSMVTSDGVNYTNEIFQDKTFKVDHSKISFPEDGNCNQTKVIPKHYATDNADNVKSNNATTVNRSSWASLFSKTTLKESVDTTDKSKTVIQSINNNINFDRANNPPHENFGDPNLYRARELILNFSINNQIISLQPRGLVNKSNYCYINSILQALIACPPLYNFFEELSKKTFFINDKRKGSIIKSMAKFFNEFNHLPADLRISRRIDKNSKKKDCKVIIKCDPPLEPIYIYKMLNGIRSDTFLVEGRQEDAEEFLGCLLNSLNDEMVELIKVVEEVPVTNSDSDALNVIDNNQFEFADKEWKEIGSKNRGNITRRTEFTKTPISTIFGGTLRSRIHRAGDQSTDSIQPFFTLPLNIEGIKILSEKQINSKVVPPDMRRKRAASVREALEVLVSKNQLEGVTSCRTNQEVEAWQQVTIEELPVILILHLKCFDYKMDSCSKIIKQLEFPIDLKIDSKMLSSKGNYTAKEKQYKLYAVVYHDGKEASKGHYITDSYHVGYASWLRYDDSSVKVVQEDQVLKPHGTKVPYLLFYRRNDTVKSK